MKPSESIKPISFLKNHTADVVRDVNENRETIIITQNGEARAIVQDIATYEQTQETLALLKLLVQGKRHRSPEMALRLAKTFGRSPESWLALQDHYDLWQAKQRVNLDAVEKLAFA